MALTAGFVCRRPSPPSASAPWSAAWWRRCRSRPARSTFLALDHAALHRCERGRKPRHQRRKRVVRATYTLLAQRPARPQATRRPVWFVIALLHTVPWSFAGAAFLNVVVLVVCLGLAFSLREGRMPAFARLVRTGDARGHGRAGGRRHVTLSFKIGPGAAEYSGGVPDRPDQHHADPASTGRRPAHRGMLANAFTGLAARLSHRGCISHRAVRAPVGLTLALATSVGWSFRSSPRAGVALRCKRLSVAAISSRFPPASA